MDLPNLRSWRLRRLLTQRELAAKAGVTQATAHRIESGAARARISTMPATSDNTTNTARRMVVSFRGRTRSAAPDA